MLQLVELHETLADVLTTVAYVVLEVVVFVLLLVDDVLESVVRVELLLHHQPHHHVDVVELVVVLVAEDVQFIHDCLDVAQLQCRHDLHHRAVQVHPDPLVYLVQLLPHQEQRLVNLARDSRLVVVLVDRDLQRADSAE